MKTKKKDTKVKIISCSAPDAQAVSVAGTFNNWDAAATPMKKAKSGKWSVRLSLLPGQYDYKFIVDGRWCCDPDCAEDHVCPNRVPNDVGSMNRVLIVTT